MFSFLGFFFYNNYPILKADHERRENLQERSVGLCLAAAQSINPISFNNILAFIVLLMPG